KMARREGQPPIPLTDVVDPKLYRQALESDLANQANLAELNRMREAAARGNIEELLAGRDQFSNTMFKGSSCQPTALAALCDIVAARQNNIIRGGPNKAVFDMLSRLSGVTERGTTLEQSVFAFREAGYSTIRTVDNVEIDQIRATLEAGLPVSVSY